MSRPYRLYTDGSTRTNPGIGAWAAILLYPNHKEEIYTKAYKHTTNNRMEFLGIIEVLEKIIHDCEWTGEIPYVEVYSDSQYVVKCAQEWIPQWLKNGWRTGKGSRPKNPDLLARIAELNAQINVKYFWVKGHSMNIYNNRCDVLAKNAMRSAETGRIHVDRQPPG